MHVPANVVATLLRWGLLVALLLAPIPASAGEMPPDLVVRFAIIGDRTGGHVPGVYEGVIAEINRLRPEFVLTVGDQIEGYTDDEAVIAREWSEYDSLTAQFAAPLYLVPGNHDIWSDLAEKVYRQAVGAPYHSFDRGPLHFVILDNSRGTIAAPFSHEQLAWLEEDLRTQREAAHTFVFFHQPFWYFSLGSGQSDPLHDLFVRYGVDAVCTGHFHTYFSGEYDGILYTSLGSSGGGISPDPSGLDYHFAYVTVDHEGIHIAPIRAGAVQPWDLVSAEDRQLFQALGNTGLRMDHPLEVDAELHVPSQVLKLTVDNRLGTLAIEDTLAWELPTDWQVVPRSVPVSIPAGGTQAFFFTAVCLGDLFPAPEARLAFPYKSHLPVMVTRLLHVVREVGAYAAEGGIKIDGLLSEDAWRAPARRLFDAQGGVAQAESAEFFFAYDAANLYLGVRCVEAEMDSLAAAVTERDGAVYGEDCVGYFFELPAGSETVYQIYFNPKGTVFDQKLTQNAYGGMEADREWNGDYEVAHRQDSTAWYLEVRIPLKQFALEAARGEEWRLNFRRKQRRLGCNADWQVPIDYNPDTYGRLLFK